MGYKVGMISLGCPKNLVDGEMMLARLRDAGYTLVSDADQADAVIINTCGFIEDAKKEAIDDILEMVQLKKEGAVRAVIVTGCLAQRYREEVLREIPELDAVIGIAKNGDIAEVVRRALEGEQLECFPDTAGHLLDGDRIVTTPSYTAYLRIADGCDNCCTYCAIPFIRGRFRSRTAESILQEARRLAADGVKELVLVAQDTTRYGLDLSGSLMLPALLHELARIDGIRWIRMLYCYPDRITDELLDAVAAEEKVLPYFDIPLQHADRTILRAMNRAGDAASLRALIEKIRTRLPDAVIRTTLIVGFPGETGREFAALAQFVRDVRFDHMGCFTFSPEEGTPAAEMSGQVEPEVKLRRQEILMEEQCRIVERRLRAQKGKTVEVLVEGYDSYAERWFGRTRSDAPDIDGKVFFVATHPVAPGDFVPVRITGWMDYDLLGETTGE